MKIDAWVLPFISLLALSVSPADAQAALRGLQRGGGRVDGRAGGRAPPPVGRGGGVTLLGVGKELSQFGRTRMIVEVDADGRDGPAAKCARLARASGGSVVRVFHRAMTGCAIEMSNVAVASMGRSTVVKSMEPDHEVHALADIPDPTWGLDRTDQCGALQSADPSSGATYEQRDATGVRVYIVDTGVNAVQQDLAPYISSHTPTCHADTSGEGGNALEDANGHGTHVAGTACGDRWGVSTNCEICAVQVLTSSGSGSTAGVITGIEWVMNSCSQDNAKCVANLSLGGGFSGGLNLAVKNAVEAGVTVVVAAGNSNADACGFSPASAAEAISVGSLTRQEAVSGFSNWGDCVNIDAPGSSIKSAWIPNAGSTNTISGTSMASPHVAGLAAGILGADPGLTPALVLEKIQDDAKETTFNDNGGRRVMVANSEGNCPGPAPTPPPTPAPPCTPQQVKIQVNILTDNYASETSWNVVDSSGEEVFAVASYSSSATLHEHESECLEPSTFTFTINDSYGDGICCSYGQGSYEVFLDGDEVASGGSFGSSESKTFEASPAPTPPAPAPTNPPGPAPTNPPVPAPTNPPVPAPTNPPTPNPTDQPTPNPTDQPTPNPTDQPTPNPTSQPTPNPTSQPTPNPTAQPTAQPTEAPTYKTCNMFTINECTSDKGCQWTGNCKNCGCHLCLDGLPENCPNSR